MINIKRQKPYTPKFFDIFNSFKRVEKTLTPESGNCSPTAHKGPFSLSPRSLLPGTTQRSLHTPPLEGLWAPPRWLTLRSRCSQHSARPFLQSQSQIYQSAYFFYLQLGIQERLLKCSLGQMASFPPAHATQVRPAPALIKIHFLF